MPDTSKYTDADKTHWEAKKLEAEAKDLLRHPLLKPGTWLALIPAVVAVVGVGLQYYASSLDYKKADILREEAEFKTDKAKMQLDDLDKEVKDRQAKLDELTRLAAQMEATRADKDAEVRKLATTVQNLKEEKEDRRQQIALAEASLAALRAQQVKSATLANEQTKIVNSLGQSKN